MITRIEALNYRCLRYIKQPLGEFHVLVGPNASGKTTFLDVIAFLGRLVSDGLDSAIEERTQNFQDLVWGRAGNRFELAVEAKIPIHLRGSLSNAGPNYDTIRYEIAVQLEADSGQIAINAEKVYLKISPLHRDDSSQRTLFPSPQAPSDHPALRDWHGQPDLSVLFAGGVLG